MSWFDKTPFDRLNVHDQKPISILKGVLWLNYILSGILIIALFVKISDAPHGESGEYWMYIGILIVESFLVWSIGEIIGSIVTNLGLIRQALEKEQEENKPTP